MPKNPDSILLSPFLITTQMTVPGLGFAVNLAEHDDLYCTLRSKVKVDSLDFYHIVVA